MKKVLVTGSGGLIGSEAVNFFSRRGFQVYGIDNDSRKKYFGPMASIAWNLEKLKQEIKTYKHFSLDIRSLGELKDCFRDNCFDLIVHTAAQPSHDWAAKDPHTDFEVNALGTLNLLECFKSFCPDAVFIFTSTNKVYGDRPNSLPFKEYDYRYDLEKNHRFFDGIDESMSIDSSLHSLFGVSKVSADLLVQEYGRYFNLKTGVFRGGCLTGPAHSGVELHGFLSYLVKSIVQEKTYRLHGYGGKQVRDNIHSFDLVNAFYHYFLNPSCGEVFNIGGERGNSLSILEAIQKLEEITGKKLKLEVLEGVRTGDHQWWISSNEKFRKQFPAWELTYPIDQILEQIVQEVLKRKGA